MRLCQDDCYAIGYCPESYHTHRPTQYPTVYPSVYPSISFSPSNYPSFEPTAFPSESMSPSTDPSAISSTSPSLMPSSLPSINPSSKPTLFVSVTPTHLPTVPPTVRPSLIPTCKPSNRPTVSPTIIKIPGSSYLVVDQVISPCSYSTYSTNTTAYNNAIKSTIVSCLNNIISSNDINPFSVSPSPFALHSDVVLLDDNNLYLEYTIIDYPNTGYTIEYINKTLFDAILNHEFDSILHTNAQSMNAVGLLNAVSVSYSSSITSDTTSSNQSSTGSKFTLTYIIIVAVVGFVVVFIIIYFMYRYFHKSSSSHQPLNRGYGSTFESNSRGFNSIGSGGRKGWNFKKNDVIIDEDNEILSLFAGDIALSEHRPTASL